jgi:hypothetical protein
MLACACVALACCTNPQQQWEADYQHCESFGFRPGTNPFATCMMNLAQQRNAQDAEYQQFWEINNAITAQNQIDQFSAIAAAQGNMGGMPPPPARPSFPNLPPSGFDGMPGVPSFPGAKCTSHTRSGGDSTSFSQSCRS